MVYTLGANWKYQESPKDLKTLSESLPKHFESWQKKESDKQKHPLYLIWSGPGTGKSRLLNEFQNLCVHATIGDKNFSELLSKAYSFRISFENGTKTKVGGNLEIGTRMMFQVPSLLTTIYSNKDDS